MLRLALGSILVNPLHELLGSRGELLYGSSTMGYIVLHHQDKVAWPSPLVVVTLKGMAKYLGLKLNRWVKLLHRPLGS